MEWIKVTDRLPEVGTVGVLAVLEKRSGTKERWQSVVGYDEEGWITVYSKHIVRITHWTPLPELPEA